MSCSIYTVSAAISSASDAANKPDMTIFQQKDNASVFIKNSLFTDPATFKSAMHGIKLLYELADPVRTIQLTPVQVESLIGHNILISESGNISVTPRTYSTYTEKMNAISDWLHSASGYARLEDTYEPDYYRRAYYDEQTDMENIFNEAGRATLKFVCKPQRYLKSGEEPITISSGGLIQNRTKYEAYPILKVTTNNTQGSVAIGNHSITIKAGAGTDPITIDCELQDAWSGTSNKNSYIVLTDGEFPVIDPGTQTVTFDGGVQSVEVIPRWWTV
jgi:phage-related protein